MRERFYQMDELQRARKLQDEAAKLHIPVPVLSWQYEIKNVDGKVEEKGIGKSNSYTRNALNSIAWLAGLCDYTRVSGAFGDGSLYSRATDGTLRSPAEAYARRNASTNPYIELGISTSAESLDDYEINTSGLTGGVMSVNSVFNSTTRKLITSISRIFTNNTASTIDITESGVLMNTYASYIHLYIHDVFTAIPVDPAQVITWTYVTEVSYPNP